MRRIVWRVALIGSGGSGGLPVDIDPAACYAIPDAAQHRGNSVHRHN